MTTALVQKIKNNELQSFSTNAAKYLLELLELGGLEVVQGLFNSIGYETWKHRNGLAGGCPICEKSNCFIGLDGDYHPIYWKCFTPMKCKQEVWNKTVPNLLGLVKAILPGHPQGEAIKTISNYLGCENPFDITNGKFKPSLAAIRNHSKLVFAPQVARAVLPVYLQEESIAEPGLHNDGRIISV